MESRRSMEKQLVDVLLKMDRTKLERFRECINNDERFSLYEKLIVDRMIEIVYSIHSW